MGSAFAGCLTGRKPGLENPKRNDGDRVVRLEQEL